MGNPVKLAFFVVNFNKNFSTYPPMVKLDSSHALCACNTALFYLFVFFV